MEPTDYKSIDCALYSEFELAIMHRTRLRLSWREPGGTARIEVLVPIDLRTRHGEEFLAAIGQDGTEREIRLDRIQSCSCL
jgi:Rho-binding antiterminator